MSSKEFNVVKLNDTSRSHDSGLYPTSSGEINLDQPIGQTVKFIIASADAQALVVGKDGKNYFLPFLKAGFLFPFMFDKVLTSGTDWEGNSRTTSTGTDFYWFGGE